jgi:hypothetical protein
MIATDPKLKAHLAATGRVDVRTGKGSKSPKATMAEQAPAEAPAAQTAAEVTRKPPEDIEAYYESSKGCFWSPNGKGQWQQFNTDALSCMLKNRGYFHLRVMGQSATEVEQFMHQVRFWRSIDWAGELAGWPCGRHTIAGMDVLITRSNSPVKPARGSYPLIRSFFKSLLGNEQLPYFLGWLKGSLQSQEEGYPFRPGQLVAFCGNVNSGKSFAQTLVTAILGGRKGDPKDFLAGDTTFTADFFKAEHLEIEDKALKDFSHAKRRAFAANLKGLIANQDQKVHPKGKEASLLPVGTRITLSCNDAPEALAILPALDVDIQDKVLYFLCREGDLPMRHKPDMTRKQQLDMFLAELPALVYFLRRWKIPADIRDKGNRFTVAAYHNPEIISRLQDLTPEQRLLQLLEILPVKWPESGIFSGTAAEIEQWMRGADLSRLLDRVLTYNASMGYLLSKIAKEGEERIKRVASNDRKNRFQILREEL